VLSLCQAPQPNASCTQPERKQTKRRHECAVTLPQKLPGFSQTDLGRGCCVNGVDLTIVLLQQVEVGNIQIHCTPGWNEPIHLYSVKSFRDTVSCRLIPLRTPAAVRTPELLSSWHSMALCEGFRQESLCEDEKECCWLQHVRWSFPCKLIPCERSG